MIPDGSTVDHSVATTTILGVEKQGTGRLTLSGGSLELTDAANEARLDLAEVLALAGRPDDDSAAVIREAFELYRRKGNLARAARAEAASGQGRAVGALARLDGSDEGV